MEKYIYWLDQVPVKLSFSLENCWQNSLSSPPGTAGGQKGTYFYLYHARQLKLCLHFMDVVIVTHPLIESYLSLQNKYKYLRRTFKYTVLVVTAVSFETCLLPFEFLDTIQDIGNVLWTLNIHLMLYCGTNTFPFKSVSCQLRYFHFGGVIQGCVSVRISVTWFCLSLPVPGC